MTRYGIIMILLVLSLGAYHLPWTVHPTAAFTVNAFDLAEFSTLHPIVQNESPALLTSQLLRMPIIFIGVMMALTATQLQAEKARWIWRAIALLVVLRLNPPVVFYPYGGGSLNDQQLGNMMLQGLVAVMVVIVIGYWLRSIYPLLMIVLSGATVYVAFEGLDRALNIIELLQLQVDTGGGYYLLLMLMAGTGGLSLWLLVDRVRGRSTQQQKGHSTERHVPAARQTV